MRGVIKIGLGVTTAVATLAALRKGVEKVSEKEEQHFEWISADAGEPEKPREPFFGKGEVVVVVSPFTSEFVVVDIDWETPLYYEIQAVIYDENSQTFRYQLDGENEWFAESWLDYAPAPPMTAVIDNEEDLMLAEMVAEEGGKPMDETNYTSSERNLLGAVLDEKARDKQVDDLLSRLHWATVNGTDEEIAEIKQLLQEVTK